MADPPPNITVEPNEANMSLWEVKIQGPVGQPTHSAASFSLSHLGDS
jgi:hypothetical protein